MASMRSVQANRESIRDHYLARQPAAPAIVELKTTVQKELKRLRKKALGKENHNNVPLYQGGSNFTRQALKGLNSITAI